MFKLKQINKSTNSFCKLELRKAANSIKVILIAFSSFHQETLAWYKKKKGTHAITLRLIGLASLKMEKKKRNRKKKEKKKK